MGSKNNGDIVEYGDYRIGLINEETNKALFDTSTHGNLIN
jgi:hypothetical protein